MKQFLTFAAALCVLNGAKGQNVINNYYQHLEERADATVVRVNGQLFNYASTLIEESEDEDLKNVKKAILKIDGFALIHIENFANPMSEFEKSKQELSAEFESLISIKDKGTHFGLYVKDEGGFITEVVGIAAEENGFFVFNLSGQFNPEQIEEVTDMVKKNQAVPLATLGDKLQEFSVYPNPVSSNSTLKIEVPEAFLGGQVVVTDVKGQILQKVEVDKTRIELPVTEVNSSHLIVEIQKDGSSYKKQLIVIK